MRSKATTVQSPGEKRRQTNLALWVLVLVLAALLTPAYRFGYRFGQQDIIKTTTAQKTGDDNNSTNSFEAGYLQSAWDTYHKKNHYAFDETGGKVIVWKRNDSSADKPSDAEPDANSNKDNIKRETLALGTKDEAVTVKKKEQK